MQEEEIFDPGLSVCLERDPKTFHDEYWKWEFLRRDPKYLDSGSGPEPTGALCPVPQPTRPNMSQSLATPLAQEPVRPSSHDVLT